MPRWTCDWRVIASKVGRCVEHLRVIRRKSWMKRVLALTCQGMRIPSVSTHHPHRRFRLRRACKGVDHELAVMRETSLRLDSADGGGKANARPGGRVLGGEK